MSIPDTAWTPRTGNDVAVRAILDWDRNTDGQRVVSHASWPEAHGRWAIPDADIAPWISPVRLAAMEAVVAAAREVWDDAAHLYAGEPIRTPEEKLAEIERLLSRWALPFSTSDETAEIINASLAIIREGKE